MLPVGLRSVPVAVPPGGYRRAWSSRTGSSNPTTGDVATDRNATCRPAKTRLHTAVPAGGCVPNVKPETVGRAGLSPFPLHLRLRFRLRIRNTPVRHDPYGGGRPGAVAGCLVLRPVHVTEGGEAAF